MNSPLQPLSRPHRSARQRSCRGLARGFSLIELLVIMGIIGALTAIGMSVLGTSAAKQQRTTTDQFTAAVEQARTAAITRRKMVILAVAKPQAGTDEEHCRFGLFEVDELPQNAGELKARQLERWHVVPTGVAFLEGRIQDFENLSDQQEIALSWKDGENHAVVKMLAFDTRGGLAWPEGSDPIAVKIGNGTYVNGRPQPITGGGHSSLRIGRVVARPWKLD